MAAIPAARGIQRWRRRRETTPLLQLLLLSVVVAGASGLNLAAPAHSAPLLSTTSSSVAGVESVLWNVSLPDEPLTPHVFVDTCASLGMLPFCAGVFRECRFVDGLCATAAVERGGCEQPMSGIAQQLGYPGADVPAFSNTCIYRAEGQGWEDGACGGSADGAVHGNSVEGPRFTLCAASPSSTKLLMEKLKKLSAVQWSLKLERDSVQNLTVLLDATDEALRQERGVVMQRDATIHELDSQLEASRADLEKARSQGDGSGGDGADPLQSPLGVQVRNLTGLLRESQSDLQQERDHNQHLENLVNSLSSQLQRAEDAVAIEKQRPGRQDDAQAAGKLEAAEAELQRERDRAAEMQAEIDQLGRLLAEAKKDATLERDRGEGCAGQLRDALDHASKLTGSLQDAQSDAQQSREQNLHLQGAVENLTSELRAAEAVLEESERQGRGGEPQSSDGVLPSAGELGDLQAELQDLRDRGAQAQDEVARLTTLLAEGDDRAHACEQVHAELDFQVRNLTYLLQDSSSELQQERDRNSHLEGMVKKLSEENYGPAGSPKAGDAPEAPEAQSACAGALEQAQAEARGHMEALEQAEAQARDLSQRLAKATADAELEREHRGACAGALEQAQAEAHYQSRLLAEARADADPGREQRGTCAEALEQAQAEARDCAEALGQAQAEARDNAAALERARAEARDQSQHRAKSRADAEQGHEQRGSCGEALEQAQAEASDRAKALEQAQAEARDLSQLLAKARADAELEHAQASELKASLDSVHREALANASSQASSAAARASSLAQDLQAAHAELEGERNRARGLQEQLDESSVTLQQASDQALVKHDQLKSTQAALQRERARVVQMDADLKGAQAQLEASGTCQSNQGSLRADLDNCTSSKQAVEVALHVERELSRKMDTDLHMSRSALQREKATKEKIRRQIFNLTLQLQECQKSISQERAQSLASQDEGMRALQREHDQSLMKDIAILDLISQLNATGGDQAQHNLSGPLQLAARAAGAVGCDCDRQCWNGDPEDILPQSFTALAQLANNFSSGQQPASFQTLRICLSPANVAAIVSIALALVGAGFGSLIAFVLLWVRNSYRTPRTPVPPAAEEEPRRLEIDGEEVTLLGSSSWTEESFAYSVSAEPPDPTAVRIISVQCPGVTHQDVEGDIIFNGIELRISRRPSRVFTEFSWSRRFRFASVAGTFEFKKEEACLENGVLTLVFRRHTPEGVSFYFPPHFDLAQDEDSDGSADVEGEVDSTADSDSNLNAAEASESQTSPAGSPKRRRTRSTSEATSEHSTEKPPKANPDKTRISESATKAAAEVVAPPGPGKVKQLRALFSGGLRG